MKYFFYILVAIALSSCSKEVEPGSTGGPENGGPAKPNGVINAALFEQINLDYPGLEKAKALYEADMYYDAVSAILTYYRLRSGITNTSVSLLNVTATEDDKSKANYALDNNRFFVNNYYEDGATKQPYSLTKDGAINWLFEPAGADNEYQKQLHRHQWFVPQAKVYRVSKDERYIQSWISVYNDWLKNNPMPASGTNTTTWWQLQVAERVLGQTQLFDYYKNSVNFTPEWFSEFMVHFAEHADFLIRYPYSEGNILIAQASALAFAGVLFPEFKNASTWMETGFETLGTEVQKQFLDDGMHYELDFSYHISAIADFYEVMKLADANKHIVGPVAADFNQYLHKAAQVVMHFTYPNYFTNPSNGYLVPGFNDTRQSSWTRSVLNRNYTRYNEMFPQDMELLYMGTYGQRGTKPSTAPKAFTTSGYYVLRNGWDRLSTMLILSNNYSENSMAVWSHNQPDNGTFELYHKGRNFFPDAGVYAYTGDGDNTDRLWYRQTKVHNTMTLGGQNIANAKGKSLAVVSNGSTEIIATENQGYNNLKHRRYVFFVDKKFFVLVDEGIGTGTGTVNLNFNLCEGDSEVIISTDKNGAHTAFADGNNILVRTFGNGSLTTVPFNGKVSYTPGVSFDRKAYSVNMIKNDNQTVRYITVLYPGEQAGTIPVTAAFTQPFRDSGVDLQVSVDGIAYNLTCNL
ncbi:heparitin sulfate lyase [Sphingobacterium sp. SGG-5]|uniref:heparin-sulfate lyase HepC n=1 Tax=Sphingobacterium sp. SGG-5 TaxID=2710881 RepID=UPI0013EC0288|nr:heparin-sulfate lyase HepC [Sphingobacterium sp. SGG-5]NGM62855.1 heparitin sulfate lyase [Sphingobacterium sp. SGG-5]